MTFCPLLVIPARMAAQRLPNKPLIDLNGLPMIVRVLKQVQKANVGTVIVACDGEAIKRAVEDHGGIAVITDPDLPSGTDRVFAAAEIFDPGHQYSHIVNVQGDQPNLSPHDLRCMVQAMEHSSCAMITMAARSTLESEKTNINVVKIAMAPCASGERTRAHYFSRSCIPSEGDYHYHHIGVYGYTRSTLKRFVHLVPSPLEKAERLEQLRAIEDGIIIEVVVVDSIPQSVDTQADVGKVLALMRA